VTVVTGVTLFFFIISKKAEFEKAKLRLEGSIKEKEEGERKKKEEDQQKLTIQIKCGDLLLSTLVTASMTVGETVRKLRAKVSVPDADKYALFLPTGKNTFKPMEDARKVVSYRMLLPSFRGPSKVVLEFLPMDTLLQEDDAKVNNGRERERGGAGGGSESK
jgi:hypothetical protein